MSEPAAENAAPPPLPSPPNSPLPPPPPRRRRRALPSPLHAGFSVTSFYNTHIVGAVFPLAAGFLLFGWRALATVGIVLLFAAIGLYIWRRIGWRGTQIEPARCIWMSILLGLALPPHLLADVSPTLWPILPAAGLLLVIVTWLLGGLGSGRVHPMLVAFLAINMLFHPSLAPHWVLRANAVATGELFKAQTIDAGSPRTDTWLAQRTPSADYDAWYDPQPAASRLILFTSGLQTPERTSVTLQMVLRDQLPPLEDLIIGGQPTPIASASALAVIIGGLFLIYRGLIDYRVPLLAILAAAAAMLILPIPLVITDFTTEWHWLAFRDNYLGLPAAITFVNYELLASPLLFVSFFLATAPIVCPITRRGRTIFAILLGLLCGPAQLYASIYLGPYIALLIVSMATPMLDRLFGVMTLV